LSNGMLPPLRFAAMLAEEIVLRESRNSRNFLLIDGLQLRATKQKPTAKSLARDAVLLNFPVSYPRL
jgi:hypothetical protein